MRIFITGGTGFIGKFVVEKLQKDGHHLLVHVLEKGSAKIFFRSSKNIRVVFGTLSNINHLKPILNRFKPDATIHLAWEGIPRFDAETSSKNLIQGLKLVALLAEIGCKLFIGAGSCWEYGRNRGRVSENMIPTSFSAFTAAKYALYTLGTEIAKEKGMRFVWARFFFVYGPGQRDGSLIPSAVLSAKNGQALELKNPNRANDFIYVMDVADAIALFIKKHRTVSAGVYNIGSGHLTAVQDIIKKVCIRCGVTYKNKSVDKKFVGFYADISKIRNSIGWRPHTKIREGISVTIDYYKNLKKS